MQLKILYEDNHLLVVNKPAGLATMGDGGRPTLHSLAAEYLKEKYNKPHSAYVGIVSRLDALVSGVIVLARTSKAAARLNTQFADHAKNLNLGTDSAPMPEDSSSLSMRKTYLAVVRAEPHRSAPLADSGVLDDFLYKDDAAHRTRATSAPRDDAKLASLRFQTLFSSDHSSVLAVAPLTGRKHQIRVQLASRGWPILGDQKYGSQTEWPTGIALHSLQLTIEHPTRREPMTFTCPPPIAWNRVRSRELESQWNDLRW